MRGENWQRDQWERYADVLIGTVIPQTTSIEGEAGLRRLLDDERETAAAMRRAAPDLAAAIRTAAAEHWQRLQPEAGDDPETADFERLEGPCCYGPGYLPMDTLWSDGPDQGIRAGKHLSSNIGRRIDAMRAVA